MKIKEEWKKQNKEEAEESHIKQKQTTINISQGPVLDTRRQCNLPPHCLLQSRHLRRRASYLRWLWGGSDGFFNITLTE